MADNPSKPVISKYPADTLGMSPEEMRDLGHHLVDTIVDRLVSRHDEPAIEAGDFGLLLQQLGGSLPETPGDPVETLALLTSVALANQQHADHPRYFARVPGPSSFAAVLGEWLATGFNTIAASWAGGSGPATVELVVIDWLRQLMGFPETTEGILVSGGSLANLTAFSAARAAKGTGQVYLSDQGHASLLRGLRELGFSDSQLRILPSDNDNRMSIDSLDSAINEDRESSQRPMMVVASAGTTNTGAIDPLPEIHKLCRKHDLWFHIDGAYGAPAMLTEQGRQLLQRLQRADSLVIDPHKWLFQPYDIGCVLVRHAGALEKAYAMNPEYLKDVQGNREEVDFRNRSLELSRRSRAIKLWMTFKTYGLARIRDAIQRGIDLAEFAQAEIETSTDWELVTPAQLGIVTFARQGKPDQDHATIAKAISATGFATLSSTEIKGRSVLRLCTINPLTTEEDIRETLKRLANY